MHLNLKAAFLHVSTQSKPPLKIAQTIAVTAVFSYIERMSREPQHVVNLMCTTIHFPLSHFAKPLKHFSAY